MPCALLGRGFDNVEHERHWHVVVDVDGRDVEGWCFGFYGPAWWAARERRAGGHSARWERRRRRQLERDDPRRR